MKRFNHHRPAGIILLVVLGMLTFFSVMAAAYLVFSSQSRQTSFAMASRSIKQPNTNALMNEALMTLIRGTNDPNHPFYGEDLLSDYYGRTDSISLVVVSRGAPTPPAIYPPATPLDFDGFIRVTVDLNGAPNIPNIIKKWDDLFAGRIITFTSGAHVNQSYRVLRSLRATSDNEHDLIFEAKPGYAASVINNADTIQMNGTPRNSPGIGYNAVMMDASVTDTMTPKPPSTNNQPLWQPSNPTQDLNAVSNPGIGYSLPVALQPNHLGRFVDKSRMPGDFDEGYDAPDYNNWFLSGRTLDAAGNVIIIPSFHRPSVINYIINQEPDFDAVSDYSNIMASLARATMRPLPLVANQIGNPTAINERFTGGNSNFALRVPINVTDATRLDQILRVLTGDPTINNPYDVDNDGDGKTDSVWVDIDLPLFTSPEGKLIKPLVAVMIEDLGGRLNVNAHSNYALVNADAGITGSGNDWAGNPPVPFVFRGLGFGPAEINIPKPSPDALSQLIASRYQGNAATDMVPGAVGADPLSVLTSGRIPRTLGANAGYSASVDPYGHGGYGISPSGNLVSILAGRALTDNSATSSFTEPDTNESVDNPYEFDPSGRLAGDQAFTLAELEAILRSSEFGGEILPARLRTLLQPFLNADPDFARKVTTVSRSDNAPAIIAPNLPAVHSALALLINPALTDVQLKKLIAPELRLGNRLNVNRPFGNGVDDNGNGVIDEPSEHFLLNVDDDGDGNVDEADEAILETNAFASHGGDLIHPNFDNVPPKYDFDEPTPVAASQLMARHLYVLMMTLSRGLGSNNFPTYGDTLGTAVSDRNAYRARRIAQWAVNVVDYRDPDSIMTPFEYDENIANGWGVDGNLLTDETVPGWAGADGIDNNGDGTIDELAEASIPPEPTRKIVFGTENPELVFTESLATHDVRVRDTNLETSGNKKGANPGDDDDTDQMRVPQGSLFLELYCPRENVSTDLNDPAVAGIPRELYNVNVPASPGTVTYALDLDRTVTTHFNTGSGVYGDSSDTAYQTPVWRIAISEPHNERLNAGAMEDDFDSAQSLRGLIPDTLSFEPTQLDELGVRPNKLDLKRFVFFTDYANVMDLEDAIAPIPDITDQAEVFFNQLGASTNLLPEQYLTLAPRTTTHFGSTKFADTGVNPTSPSGQVLEIRTAATGRGLIQDDLSGTQITPNTSTTILPGLGLVISGFASVAWTGAPNLSAPEGIGLNVSEPLASSTANYYIEPTKQYTTVGGTSYPLTDAYVELAATGTAVDPLALPKDQPEDIRLNGPIREVTVATVMNANVTDPMLGTIENYRTAFLQRLTDPTRGFHPVLNPYRTVDQITIDLTIFSGEDEPGDITLQGQAPVPTVQRQYLSGSRQRDGVGTNGVGTNILHSYSTQVPALADVDLAQSVYFALNGGSAILRTTLNYLNSGFGAPVPTGVRGRPATPFAMHPWLNRPFASPYELMLVPACSQARLFEEFAVVGPVDPDIYPDAESNTMDPAFATKFIAPYRHLLNFFHSGQLKADISSERSSEFGMLFDLVGTPTIFRGELEPIDPSRLVDPALSDMFPAPMNFVDDNSRVGRINLNTLAEFEVWKGLMQGHLNAEENLNKTGAPTANQLSFESFLTSRRGYVAPGGASKRITPPAPGPYNYDPSRFDPDYPTQFAGILKASAHARFAPRLRGTAMSDWGALKRRNAGSSLLRGFGAIDQLDGHSGGTPTTASMFVRVAAQKPLAASAPYADRSRNPFLRYQTLMRMPNLVSDNSQVYLIRMTMGFFEVDAANTSSFGAEYNAATGQNERYQAMYIVDRSIPVGFIPGQDVNARDVVIFESHGQ